MLMTKWNWDDAIKVWQNEGREEGMAERTVEIAGKMKADGQSLEEIAKYTGLDLEAIVKL